MPARTAPRSDSHRTPGPHVLLAAAGCCGHCGPRVPRNASSARWLPRTRRNSCPNGRFSRPMRALASFPARTRRVLCPSGRSSRPMRALALPQARIRRDSCQKSNREVRAGRGEKGNGLAKQDLSRSAVLRARPSPFSLRVPGPYDSSRSASILLKALGLPEPLAAFMHWPTRNPSTFLLPSRYCWTWSVQRASTSSTMAPSAPSSVD